MFRLRDGADLEVRPVSAPDVAPLFALIDRDRAHLRQWLGWVDGTQAPADTVVFVERAEQQFAMNNGFQAGIWWHGTLTGIVGYHGFDWEHSATELGYWLGAAYEGHGLMTRACRLLVDYALCTVGLYRVQIRAAPENLRSRAVPRRLGFVEESVQPQAEWLYDHFVDLVVYRMLAPEWRCAAPGGK